MKILFTGVYSHLYGGLERFAERAAAALRAQGHVVDVVGDPPRELDDRDFVLPEDVQHMFLPVMAHRTILSPEARMKGVPAEQFLLTILQNTTVPVRL